MSMKTELPPLRLNELLDGAAGREIRFTEPLIIPETAAVFGSDVFGATSQGNVLKRLWHYLEWQALRRRASLRERR